MRTKFLFILIVSLISCAKQEDSVSDIVMPDENDVRQSAIETYCAFIGKQKTKSNQIEIAYSEILGPDIYLIQFIDGGFVVLKSYTEENLPLIVCEYANYNTICDNPGFARLTENIVTTYAGRNDDPGQMNDFIKEISISDTTTIEPLITAQFHQEEPFNLLAENSKSKAAGCVPIALALTMQILNYPDSLPLTYPGAEYAYALCNWEEISEHINSIEYYNFFNQHDFNNCGICLNIARIIHQIAHICEVNYEESQTSAYFKREYITNLGLSGTYEFGCNASAIIDGLENGHPTVLLGSRIGNSQNSGHAFVADGSIEIVDTTIKKVISDPSDTRTTIRDRKYLHLNFGWTLGVYNGYYIALDKTDSITSSGTTTTVDVAELNELYSAYQICNNLKPLEL